MAVSSSSSTSGQNAPLLEIRNLTMEVAQTGAVVVDDVSLTLRRGEIVGVVGESGSGKTMMARAIMRLEPPPIHLAGGSIHYEGVDVLAMKPGPLRKLRGNRVGMVFQEPMTSLNPSIRVGVQLEEGLVLHRPALDAGQRRALILRMLERIGLHDPTGAMASYPHQFSGGMRQRIMLASVMLLKPALLIADEPTTALDSMVQNEVLDLMLELTREDDTAVLMISHDLPMVARYTQRIVVMEKGRIVESGPTAQLLDAPQHPYTRKLLAAMPRRLPARPLADGKPLVEVKDLVVDYPLSTSWFSRKQAPKTMRALHGIDLTIRPREVVAVVGGSGSGKTTLGRIIAGLIKPTEGTMAFDGSPVTRGHPEYAQYRHNCQMVFQDPYSSLDPRMNIGKLVAEGMGPVHGLDGATLRKRVAEALADVELDPTLATRFPHELSGGQRQRVAIARALIRRPAFVIADEAVSALDMTVRAKILELFAELQRRYGFACLFISHDLGVVEQIADRVVVMHRGRIVEQGLRDTVFDGPQQDYTRALLGAVPKLVPTAAGGVSLQWRDDAPATRLSTSF